MKNLRSSLLFLCLLLLPFLDSSSADILLIGGGLTDENAALWGRFVEMAGGPGVAKIGCITTASSDPLDSGIYYEDMFVRYGAATATYIPVTEDSNNADSAEIVSLINEQTAFFFGGGDQARVTAAWVRADGTDTLGMQAMKDQFAQGAAVGGTSAGAMCLNTGPMLAGGLSWEGLAYGSFPGGYNPSYPDDLCYIEDGGLGFLPGYLIDTHFSERGREGRLTEILLDTNNHFGIAADEDTGVQIAANGDAEVIGTSGGVMVIDTREAVRIHAPSTQVNGVRVSFFTENDKFNIYDGSTDYASWKSDLTGKEYYNNAISSDNIFSSPNKLIRQYGVFRDTAHRLWDSKDRSVESYSYEKGPQFIVNLKKSDGIAYGGYSPTDDVFRVSYNRMVMDIDYTP